MDPRHAVIERRLEGVKRVIAVTGGKGGIGKSLVSSSLALVLAESGRATGLLDLDLTGPSAHVVLGFETGFPSEEVFGVDPPLHHGVACMSIVHFAGDRPAPLRGEDLTNALLELLAITRWGTLDVLVIDLPPGLGDTTLDLLRLLGRTEFLVVAPSSRLALETVRKTVGFLRERAVPVLGVLENMRRGDGDVVEALAREFTVPFLGALPFDDSIEDALGDPVRLSATPVCDALRASLPGVVRDPNRARG